MQDRALDDALEPGGRRGSPLSSVLSDWYSWSRYCRTTSAKLAQVHAAGGHHLGGVGILDQREQQVLQRRIFMRAIGSILERVVQCFFEALGETWHSIFSH